MLQLEIISGKQAGLLWEARRFPVWLGRAADCDLQLEDVGVWEHHCEVSFQPQAGFQIAAVGAAGLLVNQTAVLTAPLKNGDQIAIGAVRLVFRLAPTRHASLRWREAVVWAGLAILSLGQLGLIAWLLR